MIFHIIHIVDVKKKKKLGVRCKGKIIFLRALILLNLNVNLIIIFIFIINDL